MSITDSSSLGWPVVSDYDTQSTANDNDEYKKISRTEDQALSKIQRAKKIRESLISIIMKTV
jgi:hypothetical protein